MTPEELLEKEKSVFLEKTKKGKSLAQRAIGSMPAAVPTDVFYLWPYPVAVKRGLGAYLVDEDENTFVDFSMGFGVSVWGHGNLAIAKAIQDRAKNGSHFGALSREVVLWSEELLKRTGGVWARFSNSGTEATMDAIRLARAATGRTKIAKIDGAYHGSHEIALVNANFPDAESLRFRPSSPGLSPRLEEEVIVLRWNDLEAAEEALKGCAALLIEPIMFNVGAIWPKEGYLEGLRQICDAEGALLIFDETKTGHTLAFGGAEEIFGVRPDIKTLGKGIGGGLAAGAIVGMQESTAKPLDEGTLPHLGTFSGTHLSAAAGAAALRVLNPNTYIKLEETRSLLEEGLQEIIEQYELPAYSIGQGAKNCLVWVKGEPLSDFEDYCKRFDGTRAEALWFSMFNRGVWLAQGQDEQTTHSIDHGEREVGLFLDAFADVAEHLR